MSKEVWHVVTSSAELLDALAQGRREIEVRGTLSGMPMITLQPGVRLRGGTLRFGAKGARLTRDNELTDVTVRTAESEVAIFNDTSVDDLGATYGPWGRCCSSPSTWSGPGTCASRGYGC
jgi:hypothetical protein